MIELMIAPDYLPRFLIVIQALNQMAWWGDAVQVKFHNYCDGLQGMTLDVRYPPLDEFRVVGWVNHRSGAVVMPRLFVDVDEMLDARIQSRRCDLLGRRQARHETWILVDRDGVMLCCGPAGARQYHTERYRLGMMTNWLRLLGRVVEKCGGRL